jgi:putative tryptophan/tyrosine transport system substrate-binding protein
LGFFIGETIMQAKIVLFIIAAIMLSSIHVAEAQQPGKVPRIGLLTTASTAVAATWVDAFRQGLRELGYIEGKNIILEIRGGRAKRDRLSDLAAELIGLKVDIIVAGGRNAVDAVKEATSTIPIVMRYDRDPVRAGIVTSLAHPGGNITGLASITVGLSGKRFELLAEVVPGVKRIAVLTSSRRIAAREGRTYTEVEAVARALGVELQVLLARDPATIDNAFLAMKGEHAQALIVMGSGSYIQHRERIIKQAAQQRLPTIYFQSIFVEHGGLVSYGVDFRDEFRRMTVFVDKILKGANPADLPVERPTKFEFVVNLKTATEIGVTIPQSVLYRATRVIK